jgi:DNA-binding protein H-NS
MSSFDFHAFDNRIREKMTLTAYTLPQLKQLSIRIEKEIAKRQSASKTDLLKKLTKMARESGMSLDDILGSAAPAQTKATKAAPKPAAARKEPLPAKYRHPNNRDLGWSGRGRKPQWVAAWLANGGSMDALEVTAQKFAKKQPRSPASMDTEPTDTTTSESDAALTTAD